MLASSTSSRHVLRCARSVGACRNLFAPASNMPQVTVDEQFPHLPILSPSKTAREPPQITTWKTTSGLRLANYSQQPLTTTLGMEIAIGARDEQDETTQGLAHLYALMAFRSTQSRSDIRLYRDVEAIGGTLVKKAGKDFVRFYLTVLPQYAAQAAEILAETTLSPRFVRWDVDIQKKQMLVDLDNESKDPVALLTNAVHAAAFYDDVGLGRPRYSADNIANLSTESLLDFHEKYVNVANMVFVGSGIEHNELKDLANKFYGQVPMGTAVQRDAAKYVGGESRVKNNSFGASTHLALAFAGAAKTSDELATARVLKCLLSEKLQSKHGSGFLSAYDDAGLIGMAGSTSPEQASELVSSFVSAIKQAADKAPTEEEFAVAKVSAALETAERLSRRKGRMAQLAQAAFAQKASICTASPIESVTAKAVQEFAQRALATRPSLASVGKVSQVPHIDAVVSQLK